MPTYLITGARRGIGLAYLKELSRDSSNTIIAIVRDLDGDLHDIDAVKAESAGKLSILEADVASPPSIAKLPSLLTSSLGPDIRINTLINNAAINHSGDKSSLTATPEVLQSHFNANVIGPALVLQSLLPFLAPNAIVANISSGAGSLQLLSDGSIKAGVTPYSISKTALNMLTVHQAWNLKGKAIVVAVDPGHVKTKMGGPKAVLETEDSARSVLGVLAALTEGDSGRFVHYTGKDVKW
jgi:NAD(P)-dependent dehydrogenase (short-subunit alcohol dehydrogenase family)